MDEYSPAPAYLRHDAFFHSRRLPTPCLLLDLDVVAESYRRLRALLPEVAVLYAVKANSDPSLVRLLVELGCGFDVASPGEITLCLAAGAEPSRISYGNTVKKEVDIAFAWRRGVRTYAFDSPEELRKIAAAAPGAQVVCRLAMAADGGAQWPLSRKFGCGAREATALLRQAHRLGLVPHGLTFHVGSQQRNPESWDRGVRLAAAVLDELARDGHQLALLNLGGGLPATYDSQVPGLDVYAKMINASLGQHLGQRLGQRLGHPLQLAIEPGRYLSADAGLIRSEVVLVAQRTQPEERRWVYVDVGRFGGLAETEGEAIRFPLVASRDGVPSAGPLGPAVLAGPTCDSVDVLYERTPCWLPEDLRAGDHIDFLATGAYTSSYSSVGFNGFPPLPTYCFAGVLESAAALVDQPGAAWPLSDLQELGRPGRFGK